jgi:2-polyprenyl-3-methyl-5-hydroxy-6-metoxy-1,4-benzoquinol methylase
MTGKTMFSIDQFNRQYDTERRDIVIDGRRYWFFVPQSIDRFIDPGNPLQDFPLWAKIWPASVVLAGHLSRLPVVPGQRILEIGSGLGVVGIIAACSGHDVTLTDANPHALEFARANAHINGCTQLTVQRLDWQDPLPEGEYDTIVGSEVVYKDQDIDRLLTLFVNCLKPQGHIILVEEMRRTLDPFFRHLDPHYRISINKKILRAADEESLVLLIQLEPHIGRPN